jgi:hypothetical protein
MGVVEGSFAGPLESSRRLGDGRKVDRQHPDQAAIPELPAASGVVRPEGITGAGQARGNSGVFLASTGPGDEGYEIQILDSWKNPTYVNGQAASIYKQAAPLVNAMRPPGQWQTYDIVWTAPVFGPDGTLKRPAYVTVLHNGVLVQDHRGLAGETVYVGRPKYRPFADAPIKLQAHGDPSAPISFRNIWVRKLD